MRDRTEDPEDAFDLGESSVEVRTPPRGREVGRIVGAGLLVAFGCAFSFFGFLLVGCAGLSFGIPLFALGFAIYDYRWVFGPRPGARPKRGRSRLDREDRGTEDY